MREDFVEVYFFLLGDVAVFGDERGQELVATDLSIVDERYSVEVLLQEVLAIVEVLRINSVSQHRVLLDALVLTQTGH